MAATSSSSTSCKFVIVSGGVLSGVGKGIIASSIGVLFRSHGIHVTHVKVDPYLNVDAGCMSPFEHGEVFVLDDGGEVDLDLGNYERFTDLTFSREHNITTGKVYQAVIANERKGKYLGKTVQVVPHITNEIQERILAAAATPVEPATADGPVLPQVCIIELGGTIGDIESMPFVEAIRQLQFSLGLAAFTNIHVSLVPTMGGNEQKSKPTQHSLRELRSLGLWADIVICRSDAPLTSDVRLKVAQEAQIMPDRVLSCSNVSNLYKVPIMLENQHLTTLLFDRFGLKAGDALAVESPFSLAAWSDHAAHVDSLHTRVEIALVGKYTEGNADTYHSLTRALQHAAVATGRLLHLVYVESTSLEEASRTEREGGQAKYDAALHALEHCAGIIVPGGFGDRGIEGMIKAIEYARTHSKPYLGVCLGMQLAVVEFARNVLGVKDAVHAEFAPNAAAADQVVVLMPTESSDLGGTMRLGGLGTRLCEPSTSRVASLYSSTLIRERHRHRYEVNPLWIDRLAEKGLRMTGLAETDGPTRAEVCELDGHPYFVGTQFHGEYTSRHFRPAPTFLGFLQAASGQLPPLAK